MSAAAKDLIRAWTDLTLVGLRTQAALMQIGVEAASRAVPTVSAFPAPAVLRGGRQREIWPAAGSFGGGTNAVAAWTEVASSMMGVRPARSAVWPGIAINPFAWMSPQPPMLPWLAGAMSPAAFGPMAMWGRAFGLPGFGWPMPGPGLSFVPFPGLADAFRMLGMMAPMIDAFTPKPPRRSSYH